MNDADRFEILVEEMRGGFQAINEKFDAQDRRFKRYEAEADLFRQTFHNHEARITTLENGQ